MVYREDVGNVIENSFCELDSKMDKNKISDLREDFEEEDIDLEFNSNRNLSINVKVADLAPVVGLEAAKKILEYSLNIRQNHIKHDLNESDLRDSTFPMNFDEKQNPFSQTIDKNHKGFIPNKY